MKQAVLLLGGGQLGLMMAEAGAQLALHVDRLDLAQEQIIPGTSGLRLQTSLAQILQQYPVISAELEHLPDTPLVQELIRSPNWANPAAFQHTADRFSEKTLLDRLGIATAPWCLIAQPADLQRALADIADELVVKVIRGGYDGRGQWMVDTSRLDQVPAELMGQIIAEQKITFRREVSLVGARSRDGKKIYLPLVENLHDQGILRYSIARCTNDASLQASAEAMLGAILDELKYIGVMAMECFETDQGLLVNELAPRVHNSGHWSQLGAEHDQFALHLRALVDLPLPRQQIYQPTLMLNLIGCEFQPGWLEITGLQCHWYGKEPRPGRKVGHINISLADAAIAQACMTSLDSLLDATHREMLGRARRQLF